jgi:hypothetical protein
MNGKFNRALGALVLTAAIISVGHAEGPTVSGFIDTTYNYNFNGQRTNTLRSFDANANTFQLQNAEAVIAGKSDKEISYRVDLNFGKDASVTNYLNANAGDEFDFQQAFISMPCPLTHGLVTVGKFVTPFGAEVIEAKDNFNTSRGHLFNFAIPLHHTGIKYDKSLGDLGLTLGVVNGWDNINESNTINGNNGKTFLVQAAKPLGSKVKVILGGAYGPEQAQTASSTLNGKARSLVDAIVTFNPSDKLSLVANADWGVEEIAPSAPSDDNVNANWAGAALFAKYAFTNTLAGALRVETFDDDGSRTGTEQVLSSLTATLECKKNDVITRLELRQDKSSDKVYTDSDGALDDSQTTVGLQWIFSF